MFSDKISQKWFVLLLALITMLALAGCEPGVDEGEVPPTVTTTGLDVGVETTVEVVATPGGAEEVGIDETVPAQDPLLPVTGTPAVTAPEEPVAEATLPAPVETSPAFEEAMRDQSIVPVRLSNLIGHLVTSPLEEDIGEVVGILVDTAGTLPYILLDASELLDRDETIVAVETNLFEATYEDGGEGSTVFYLGSIPYLQSLAPLDPALDSADRLFVNADEVGLAAEVDEELLGINDLETLTHLNLVNGQGEELGEVQDLIVDLSEGLVLYTVVDVGEFLGINENTIAVPWQQLQFDAAEEHFVVDVDRETLANAPTLNLNEWEQPVAPDWDADIRGFWQGQ